MKKDEEKKPNENTQPETKGGDTPNTTLIINRFQYTPHAQAQQTLSDELRNHEFFNTSKNTLEALENQIKSLRATIKQKIGKSNKSLKHIDTNPEIQEKLQEKKLVENEIAVNSITEKNLSRIELAIWFQKNAITVFNNKASDQIGVFRGTLEIKCELAAMIAEQREIIRKTENIMNLITPSNIQENTSETQDGSIIQNTSKTLESLKDNLASFDEAFNKDVATLYQKQYNPAYFQNLASILNLVNYIAAAIAGFCGALMLKPRELGDKFINSANEIIYKDSADIDGKDTVSLFLYKNLDDLNTSLSAINKDIKMLNWESQEKLGNDPYAKVALGCKKMLASILNTLAVTCSAFNEANKVTIDEKTPNNKKHRKL